MVHVFPLGDSTLAGHRTADELVAPQEAVGKLHLFTSAGKEWGGGLSAILFGVHTSGD